MKRIIYPFMALLAISMSLSSCKKDEALNEESPVFKVTAEAPIDDQDTKTVFSGVNSRGYWEFYWKNTDKIAVYDNNGNRAIYTDHGANGTSRVFANFQRDSGNVTVSGGCKAFYPSFYVGKDGGNFVYTLPAVQQLDNDGVDHSTADVTLTRFPMAGVNEGNELHLKNLCGILRIMLQADGKAVRSITFESLENDKQLHGSYYVTFDDNGIPSLTKTQAGSAETKSVKLSFQVPVSINTTQSFYIALPPDNYTGYRIKVEDADGKIFSVKSTGTCPIIRSQMTTYKRGKNVPGSGKEITFKIKGGRFTIERNGTTPTRKVYIAPGNLQYKNTNWQFADQQYQIIHDNTYNPSVTYRYDLFALSVTPDSRFQYGKVEPYPLNWNSTRDFWDWGHVFDGVDEQQNPVQSPWFTLTKPQWNCMLHERSTSITIGNTSNARFAPVIINGQYPGYILFPDSWVDANYTFTGTWPSGSTVNYAPANTDWHLNQANMTLSMADYLSLESAGCAFLPMTGYAQANTTTVGGWTSDFTDLGFYYWTASRPDWAPDGSWHCCQWVPLYVQNHDLYFMDNQGSENRYAVRLVREAPLN